MMLVIEIVFWLSLAVLLYTYFGYPLLLMGCHFVCRRRASEPDETYRPSISIVLAAYNEADCIRRKLDNCLALDYPAEKLQILVGSDGSDDGTNEIVLEYRDRGVELLAFHPRRGKMATVNRIVQQASGEICVFSDISEVFEPDVPLQLVRHFADPQIGAVTGNHIYNKEKSGIGAGTSFYWKLIRFLQAVESRLHTVCACDGTIYACRRELFPFPPDNTINDDVAVPLGIISRRGKRVIFEPKAIARGDVLQETRRFFRQKIRGQAGKYQVFGLFPKMFVPWPPSRALVFLSHTVLPVLVPWFLVLVLATNIFLWFSGQWYYQGLLILQGSFYLLALAGCLAEKFRVYAPLAAIPFYFVTANLGSLCGFFAYVGGVQKAAWRKVE
ncbi:MAG: glycosyltransferase family 2 protein [Pirellulales bacterium]|nr:glycosyltransferase family 2 protein [Pirellulales bacterium]